MDQRFLFGGTIGYRDSIQEYLFRQFNVFRLHAILHDATGAVGAQSGKGAECCYMTVRGLNSCLFGYLTGRLFFPQVELIPLSILLMSIFESLCLALYKVLSLQIKTISQSWDFFWESSKIHFSFSKKVQNHTENVLLYKSVHGIV